MRSVLLLCTLAVGTLALTPAEIREFKVRDVVDHNTGMKGVVTLTEGTDTITIVSNAIPDHATPVYPNPENPFPIVPQNVQITIPKNPQVANHSTCLNMGAVGVAINGVPIYNPFSLECRDANVYEVLDQCDGHPSPQGEYHYHIHPDCVFDGTSTHSQIVGVAADGFAIYGPVDESGIVLTNADLDECHGRMKDGVYRYHVTNAARTSWREWRQQQWKNFERASSIGSRNSKRFIGRLLQLRRRSRIPSSVHAHRSPLSNGMHVWMKRMDTCVIAFDSLELILGFS
ncbi:uncharacterized protein LOC118423059 [Branchiostoma floridae]|uniref:Uncharacterized protein LOC118423059 n=1 Tax=Branchiostoma floridae TaxID=7739 RepID=A0A9J7LT96_BRAFL|nr:uncharacterized protein LOC118423059 [Branchiostoma floridae]